MRDEGRSNIFTYTVYFRSYKPEINLYDLTFGLIESTKFKFLIEIINITRICHG